MNRKALGDSLTSEQHIIKFGLLQDLATFFCFLVGVRFEGASLGEPDAGLCPCLSARGGFGI